MGLSTWFLIKGFLIKKVYWQLSLLVQDGGWEMSWKGAVYVLIWWKSWWIPHSVIASITVENTLSYMHFIAIWYPSLWIKNFPLCTAPFFRGVCVCEDGDILSIFWIFRKFQPQYCFINFSHKKTYFHSVLF